MTGKRTHVVVIGGGYAGMLAANHLRLRGDVDITLVNPRPKFVERIRLHQLVAGTDDADRRLRHLLGDGIRLVVDSASRIDTGAQTVELASGRTPLHYDYLIYAVGSTGAVPASVPGAAEFAYPDSGIGAGAATARGDRRAAPRRARHRGRRGADRHRDGLRAGRAGPQGHAGVRRAARPVAVRAGPTVGRQVDAQARGHGARVRRGGARCARMRWCSPTAPCARAP